MLGSNIDNVGPCVVVFVTEWQILGGKNKNNFFVTKMFENVVYHQHPFLVYQQGEEI